MVNSNETYNFLVVPTYTRYRKDNFGIYEFYTEQEDIPHLQEQKKDNDLWDFTEGSKNKTVYTGIMLGVSQDLEHKLSYNLTAKCEYNDKFQTHQYKIISISPTRPDSSIESKRFLYTILTEKQSNTLIDAYPNIVDDVVNDPEFNRITAI